MSDKQKVTRSLTHFTYCCLSVLFFCKLVSWYFHLRSFRQVGMRGNCMLENSWSAVLWTLVMVRMDCQLHISYTVHNVFPQTLSSSQVQGFLKLFVSIHFHMTSSLKKICCGVYLVESKCKTWNDLLSTTCTTILWHLHFFPTSDIFLTSSNVTCYLFFSEEMRFIHAD